MDILRILKENCIVHEDQGYALYFYQDGKEYQELNGKVSDNESENITFDTNFRLASVTKQFIAYSIVNLINEGKLSYNTIIKDLYDYLPDYFSKITIKDLLCHTSGIYDYEDISHNEDDKQIIDREILPFLRDTKGTYFEPGTKYRYSNTAYVLLCVIIEDISGMSIVKYVDENIFKLAQMKNSVVNVQGETNVKNRAYGHIINEENNLVVKDQYWCSATIGDGGIYSNINDLKKWCKFLSKSKYFKEMTTKHYVGENENNDYCLGLRNINCKGKEIIYHCGSTIGTSTLLLFSLDYNICLIFLSNMNGIDTAIMKDNLVKHLNNLKEAIYD